MEETALYRIGSGAGFSGDRVDAAQSVVEAIAVAGSGGAIIFETIGERTLALGQIARHRDPKKGYEPLLEQFLPPILKTCVENRIVIVGNFGCANPRAAAEVVIAMGRNAGLEGIRVAVVEGDDLHGKVDVASTERWEGDVRLPPPSGEVIAINAYIGARAIAEAIREGAQVVVTGRVADPALALGPLAAHFGWDWSDLDLMAAGTLVGHLLECGAQVSGGFFADPGYKDVPEPANIGFPIAEVAPDGTFVLTKAQGTGGCIDPRTVKEQLLYEIHDPAAYLTPDVTLDLTDVEVKVVGRDRVRVSGARGHAPPEKLKATVGYYGDWLGEAEISYAGPNAFERARLAISIIRRRLAMRGLDVASRADVIGTVSVFDDDCGTLLTDFEAESRGDYRIRFAFGGEVSAVEAAVQEVNALYCCGPAGGGGIRQSVRARVRTVSHLVPRSLVSVSHAFVGGQL
jgi:hypothetical protein